MGSPSFHLPPPSPFPTANATVGQPFAAARVRFYHSALFSPALSTLQKAIDAGYLQSIPGLDASSLRRHPPQSEATIKGHLNAQRNNVRSTKKTYTTPHHIYNATLELPKRTHSIYTDCLLRPDVYSLTSQDPSSLHQQPATSTYSSCMTTTTTLSMPSPFPPAPRNNSSKPTALGSPASSNVASFPSFNA